MTRELSDWVSTRLPAMADPEMQPLRVEASFRTFYRIRCRQGSTDASYVLMVSPPEKEDNERFETLAAVFLRAQIPVPDVLARDRARGWFLMTDLGPRDLEAAYATDDREPALQAAVETLVRLQRVQDPAITPYTAARFADELTIFRDWFAAAALGLDLPAAVENSFRILVERTQQQQQVCVHRDYHCRNLLFNDDRLGVVDFQDALVGPVSYDLASLLHDCYYEFAPQEVERWTARYLALTDLELDPMQFRVDLEHTAIQRQLKAVGIFARLQLRDGKATHLPHIAPVLARCCAIAQRHQPLSELAGWLAGLDVDRALETLAHGGRG